MGRAYRESRGEKDDMTTTNVHRIIATANGDWCAVEGTRILVVTDAAITALDNGEEISDINADEIIAEVTLK